MKCRWIFLSCAWFCSSFAPISQIPSEDTVSKQVRDAYAGFTDRWNAFEKEKHEDFSLWTPEWKREELEERFSCMALKRFTIYLENPASCQEKNAVWKFKERYQVPQNIQSWHSRYSYPHCFVYNLASPQYDASLVILQDLLFLAMQAPSAENVESFFQLLQEYKVTDLVRLTPAQGRRENCFPYWEGRINIHPATGFPTLEIGGREITYFPLDSWHDHNAFEIQRLIALVKSVMHSQVSEPKVVAVHCRAGVGRTGTFIAAYALIHDIDEQLKQGIDATHVKVSVDKIFWELSLQRPFSISTFDQYESLYKLVQMYIDSCKKIDKK